MSQNGKQKFGFLQYNSPSSLSGASDEKGCSNDVRYVISSGTNEERLCDGYPQGTNLMGYIAVVKAIAIQCTL